MIVPDINLRTTPKVPEWERIVAKIAQCAEAAVRNPQGPDDRLALPGIQLAPLTPEAAIESSFLPGQLHSDPADRLLVATAHLLEASLVTRDASLIDYGAAGHLRVISC